MELEHFPIYKGTRVSLGPMQKAYAPEFVRGITPEALEGIMMVPPVTVAGTEAFIEGLEKRSATDDIFAVLYHESEDAEHPRYRYIGHMGLHHITWPRASATTGSILFDTRLHARGVGTEAKLLLLHHAFHVRRLRVIKSEVKAFNGNSWGHLLKCGYQEIGRVPDFHPHGDGYVDEILFYVTREGFEPIWKKYQESGELPTLSEEQRAQLEKETGRARPKKD